MSKEDEFLDNIKSIYKNDESFTKAENKYIGKIANSRKIDSGHNHQVGYEHKDGTRVTLLYHNDGSFKFNEDGRSFQTRGDDVILARGDDYIHFASNYFLTKGSTDDINAANPHHSLDITVGNFNEPGKESTISYPLDSYGFHGVVEALNGLEEHGEFEKTEVLGAVTKTLKRYVPGHEYTFRAFLENQIEKKEQETSKANKEAPFMAALKKWNSGQGPYGS